MKLTRLLSVATMAVLFLAAPRAMAATALILDDPALPHHDPRLAAALAGTLERAGYTPQRVATGNLPEALTHCALLVLPAAAELPAPLAAPVHHYLQTGGHLLALGAPAWNTALEKDPDGHWLPPGEGWALVPPPHMLFDIVDPAPWQHISNAGGNKATLAAEPAEAQSRHATAFHAQIPNLTGYDLFRSPPLAKPGFPAGHTMTVFSARGGPQTTALAIDWIERDGSRWIATVPLRPIWQRYHLPPQAFKSWSNPPERTSAGFRPENASRLTFGLGFDHTGHSPGTHEFWVAQPGTASAREAPEISTGETLPPLETLAPAYKFFPIHGPVQLQVDPSQVLVHSTGTITVPDALIAAHPRTSGAGFAKGRPWRSIPILQATAGTQWRGNPGTLLLYPPGKNAFGGGLWLVFTPTVPAFYLQPAMQEIIEQAARRLRDGLLLTEGGAEFYVCFPGQRVRLGAGVANTAAEDGPQHQGHMSVTLTTAAGAAVATQSWPVALGRGQTLQQQFLWTAPTTAPPGGYLVTTELRENDQVVDRLQQTLTIQPEPTHPEWVTIGSDGHFYRQGKLWRINGVNYMPSSGVALNDGHLYEDWLSAAAYDPQIIERDLSHIEDLGFNALSVFIYRDAVESQNLLDLLCRCRHHHLGVNLSLRPGVASYLQHADRNQAQDQAWDTFRHIITQNRLAQDDTVFAYEIDWEPSFTTFGRTQRTDDAWAAWVTARYGSIAAAENAWDTSAPRNAQGRLTAPPLPQLQKPGPGGVKLPAAYRRFLDDWLAETYAPLVQKIHALAPHQPVSFRMAGASDPLWESADLNYQFEGLARAVDFLSPESYGPLEHDAREVALQFRVAYGRAVAPHQPIIWAETGMTIWNKALQADDPAGLISQGDYYRRFYQLAGQAGSDGIFWWWYPGGFRVGEDSDYGLINPDGTDRPATTAIRQEGPKFLALPPARKPDVVLDFDRAAYPDGARGVFHALQPHFAQELDNGHVVGLRAQPGE